MRAREGGEKEVGGREKKRERGGRERERGRQREKETEGEREGEIDRGRETDRRREREREEREREIEGACEKRELARRGGDRPCVSEVWLREHLYLFTSNSLRLSGSLDSRPWCIVSLSHLQTRLGIDY